MEMVEHLSASELATLMRQGWGPYRDKSGWQGHAAIDGAAARACQQAGYTVTATADHQAVTDSILSKYGKQLTHIAANRLADLRPRLSARPQARWHYRLVLVLICAAVAGLAVLQPDFMKAAGVLAFSVLSMAISCLKLASLFAHGKHLFWPPGRRLDDAQLPVYTVLVPLFGETSMLPQIIRSLKALRYPAPKLDVKIIVEQGDADTRDMARLLVPDTGFQIITVSPGSPQTKPRALNLALMFARGELVTIYDAEDIPLPMQLLLAAQCFAAAPAEIACLQARLAYYNSRENWLIRQFTIEYASLFDLMLPLLARFGLPLPLGGTSNHFRHCALKAVGGWDAWNVTEDVDLGLRLARIGYRSELLNCTIFEEANCRTGNWLHQRARWMKGWMQTWLVIMRSPFAAWRSMGTSSFLIAQLMMAGMIGSALLHPVFLVMLLHDHVFAAPDTLEFADHVYRTSALVVLVCGYGAAMLAGARALTVRRMHALLPDVLTMPFYWLPISVGGWLALWQLLSAPFYWNKTRHGISRVFRRR